MLLRFIANLIMTETFSNLKHFLPLSLRNERSRTKSFSARKLEREHLLTVPASVRKGLNPCRQYGLCLLRYCLKLFK